MVVDDSAVIRGLISRWIEAEQDLTVAASIRTGLDAVNQVTRIDPYEKDSHLCILQSGAQVPVSKAGYVKLKAVLGL